MQLRNNGCRLVVALFMLVVISVSVEAQTPRPTSGSDRLFLSFIEDATVVETQWWEAQVELADQNNVDFVLLRGVVAFQPLQDIEFGGSVGFGSTSATAPAPDGDGATDLDLWGKYYINRGGQSSEFALGGIITLPTGDDSVGLGQDAFAFTIFGSWRQSRENLIFNANAGLRLNRDGRIFGVDLEGKTSPFLAFGVIRPLSDRASVVGEASIEAERFDGADEDVRLLGGVNWRPFNRGTFRGAIMVGLTDGAPDSQLIGSYAYSF